MNCFEKGAKDAAELVPDWNQCWIATRVVEVKRAYGVTVDLAEAAALEQILRGCTSREMEPMLCTSTPTPASDGRSGSGPGDEVLAKYDDNGNGRITCKEARRHGIAPVHRSHSAYRYTGDGGGDEMNCELGDRFSRPSGKERDPSRLDLSVAGSRANGRPGN